MFDGTPLILTLKLALITTALLFLIGIPAGYWLSRSNSRFKHLVQAFISLPLILPPTVLGFYLLLAFSPENAFGAWLEQWFDVRLAFTFEGLVIASIIYSLPFMVQPLHSGFKGIPEDLREAAHTMGAGFWRTLFRVELPNMKNALLTGGVLTFAHTVGEFGVVLMIGGNIPGETRVASIAIYNEVEALDYGSAHAYSLILLGVSFAVLATVHFLNRKSLYPWKGSI